MGGAHSGQEAVCVRGGGQYFDQGQLSSQQQKGHSRTFTSFQVLTLAFEVRILAFKVQNLFAIPARSSS